MAGRRWEHPRRLKAAGVWLAVGVGLIQIVGTTLAARHQTGRDDLDALGYFLLAAGPAALFLRRRYPVEVLAVAFAATLAYASLNYPRGPIYVSLAVAFFNAVFRGHRLAAWISLPLGYVGFLWLPYLSDAEPAPTLGAALGLLAWLLVLGAAAEMIRTRKERAVEARRIHHEETLRKASEERLRIARELHDVLGHNISLINVQAGVALHLMDERPEQARTALAAIKEASGETLREMRAVLGVLRQADEEAPRSPAPGMSRLEDLVARAGAAGIRVSIETEGSPRPVPAGVDLAAFRIVQEALTNVTRHAGSPTATVKVTYGDEDLTVQIDDDGRGSGRTNGTGGGSGIRGMRERAEALGGELAAGSRPDGGFRVLARLPLGGEP